MRTLTVLAHANAINNDPHVHPEADAA